MVIRCDFCGKELDSNYKRPGIVVRDPSAFVIDEFDACNEDASLIEMLLRQRIGQRSTDR